MFWTWGKSLRHGLDLMKLITCFVPCCTDIVALYTDTDEGTRLHVETLLRCGVPRFLGSAALAFLATS